MATTLTRIMHALSQRMGENEHKATGRQDFRTTALAVQAKQTAHRRTPACAGAADASKSRSWSGLRPEYGRKSGRGSRCRGPARGKQEDLPAPPRAAHCSGIALPKGRASLGGVASQTFTVLSAEALARRRPSGLKHTLKTLSVCPLRVSASRRSGRPKPSPSGLPRRWPSGLEHAPVTPPASCPAGRTPAP
jgi:hypothetical protein